ncbi:MAG TPA: hypothetical protein VK157_06880 [Phycisphaerales bacterium]|nr:hypothetical protein [Phycisphaerales bacterium]
MPRPTSLLDSVGYVESQVNETRWMWPGRRPRREVARAGGVSRTPHWWVKNPKRRRYVIMMVCTAVAATLLAVLALPEQARIGALYAPMLTVFAFMSLERRWVDPRVGGARYLRTAPLRRIARELEAERRAALGMMAVQLFALRKSERLRDTRRYAPRAQDMYLSPDARRVAQGVSLLFYGTMAVHVFSTSRVITGLPVWLGPCMMMPMLIVMMRVNLRRTVSERVDKRQAAGRCPDCDYDVSALGDDPAMGGLVPGCGPASCPECGVVYPLVPPPTAREVAEGNRPDLVK